jgi:hypothetical protein
VLIASYSESDANRKSRPVHSKLSILRVKGSRNSFCNVIRLISATLLHVRAVRVLQRNLGTIRVPIDLVERHLDLIVRRYGHPV